jgi:hypothetical protein
VGAGGEVYVLLLLLFSALVCGTCEEHPDGGGRRGAMTLCVYVRMHVCMSEDGDEMGG